jgi:tetratricopeptide (TPR) repeat protein
VAAFRKANLELVLSMLHGNEDSIATTLRARCLLRLGRVREAADELRDVSLDGVLARAEVNVLTASTAARLERPDRDEAFADAELALEELGSSSNLSAELAFIRARTAWTDGDLDRAEAFASAVLAVEHDDATSILHLYHHRALALELLGLIASDREQFGVAAVHFRDALSDVDAAPFADEWITAFVTANVAMLARDFPWSADSAFLVERINRVRWVPSIASRRYYCLHGLGWCYAHEGNHVGALRAFHQAADVAPTIPLRIAAWADHAMLGRELGSAIGAEESARYAADLASAVDWKAANDNEQLALLFLAETLVPIDVPAARAALKQYDDVRTSLETAASLRINPENIRIQAFERRAEAVVTRAEGLIPRAHALFREEYEIWRRIGSEPRAAVAALDAYELDADPALLEFARNAAAATPLSWVARRVAQFT